MTTHYGLSRSSVRRGQAKRIPVFLATGVYVCLICLSAFGQAAECVFVQLPVEAIGLDDDFHPSNRYVDGARIVALREGELENLTEGFASACDPALSFDAKTMMFSAKRKTGDSWSLWRMDLASGSVEAIDVGVSDCVSPLYTGDLFHLNDEAPSSRMVFVSKGHGGIDERGAGPAYSLYACWLDGSGLQRLSYNLSADFDPCVTVNGRLAFSSWQAFGGASAPAGKVPLLAVNIDGADMMMYYAEPGLPRYRLHPGASTSHVYFVESINPDALGGGALRRVSQRRPYRSDETLTGQGIYAFPNQIDDARLLVSYRASEDEAYSLHRLDVNDSEAMALVHADEHYHCVDAHAVVERAVVDGRSSVVNVEKRSGAIYCVNVYESQNDELYAMPPGAIKRVRVIEGLPVKQSLWNPDAYAASRIVGYAPVEEDGSFHITAPADTPLALQLLDANGVAVDTHRSWMWVRPGERRGCIGCHEDPELAPPNRLPHAVVKPAVDLTLTTERRRVVDFKTTISPIINANCVECHNHDSELPLHDGRATYERLMAGPNALTKPGSARNSRLISTLLDGHHTPEPVEMQQLIEWVDLGAHWDLSTARDETR